MKQYEYAIDFVLVLNGKTHKEFRPEKSYEDAMKMAKHYHKIGATEVRILRRSISDWKPIHQSGFSEGIK